jgi:hypothetical protein
MVARYEGMGLNEKVPRNRRTFYQLEEKCYFFFLAAFFLAAFFFGAAFFLAAFFLVAIVLNLMVLGKWVIVSKNNHIFLLTKFF